MQLPTLITQDTNLSHAPNPDTIWVELLEDKALISIDQIHELQATLNYRVTSKNPRIVLVRPAEKLSLPAQQSLLKLLEEPPENTQIILVTEYPGKLLPTILSRATISGREVDTQIDPSSYDQLINLKISEALKFSDDWSKSREETIGKLRQILLAINRKTHEVQSAKLLTHERAVISCIEQLDKNVNAKLALDRLFFTLSSQY